MKPTYILHNRWALGDTVCMSALARDIHLAYPNKYEILATGHYQNVGWVNNPWCKTAPPNAKGQLVQLSYTDGIRAAGRGEKIHFLSWFHRDFERLTGIHVPVRFPKGDIHLSAKEQANKPDGRYWVIVAGGKIDMTAKVWSVVNWQATVNILRSYGIRCIQAGGAHNKHFHPRLQGVEQFVGKTQNERDFFALIAGAEGVICGITAAMHIAAVFDKPCVVIAGGREEPWWEHYYTAKTFGPQCAPVQVPHKYLHTLGLLDCGVGNMVKGCWRDRATPLQTTDYTDPRRKAKLCLATVTVGQQVLPRCLALITPEHVVEAVMNYFEEGVIPPIGKPTGKYPLRLTAEELPTTPPAPPAWVTNPLALTDKPAAEPAWNKSWDRQLPAKVKPRDGELDTFGVLDHPYVGGRFTLFVLGFGDNLSLMERCIDSIVTSCPSHRFDLRLGLNQPSDPLLRYAESLQRDGIATKIYVDTGSRRKYPAMREMFWDNDCPIETPYVCWFDDDSWCRHKDWMVALANSIRLNHPQQGRLYGARMYHDISKIKRPEALREKWFKAGSWWRNRPLYTNNGRRLVPNGSQIVFASGGFWALATHVIREADIPDPRLNHNGGDITIGGQVTQAGYKVVDFSSKKELIAWSDATRRGFAETFPWA
jgi:hypothetical protein